MDVSFEDKMSFITSAGNLKACQVLTGARKTGLYDKSRAAITLCCHWNAESSLVLADYGTENSSTKPSWALTCESRGKLSTLWSKAMPSSLDNYSHCGDLLACYWEAEETEQLTTGHQLAIQRELPIMTRVLFDSSIQKQPGSAPFQQPVEVAHVRRGLSES